MQCPHSKETDTQQRQADGDQPPLLAIPGHPPGETKCDGGDDGLYQHSEVGSREQEFEHSATVSGEEPRGVPLHPLGGTIIEDVLGRPGGEFGSHRHQTHRGAPRLSVLEK